MTESAAAEAGRVLWRDEDGYEDARLDAVWHQRKPDRRPAVIVVPRTEQEVVAAVRLARERGLQVKACSGGHSFTCSSHREGGMLIDLGELTETVVDAEAGAATAQPGASGRVLNEKLEPYDLFFPAGHCQSVALGGYLLQGGWGWYSRELGPACVSVVGVDVVTAEGELVHADANENPDLLWAARGSGSGFFGVVTRFYLRCHQRPRAMMVSRYIYPRAINEELLFWLYDVFGSMPMRLEALFHSRRRRTPDGQIVEGAPVPHVTGIAMGDSEAEVTEMLEVLADSPHRDRATDSLEFAPTTLNKLYDGNAVVTLQRFGWAGDGLWTDAPAEEMVPPFNELCLDVPSGAAYGFWYPWGEVDIPDSVLSVTGKNYLAGFSSWVPGDDEGPHRRWLVDRIGAMDPLSKGIQLADENLVDRPARYFTDEAGRRLEAIRDRHDPDRLFYSYFYGEKEAPGPV